MILFTQSSKDLTLPPTSALLLCVKTLFHGCRRLQPSIFQHRVKVLFLLWGGEIFSPRCPLVHYWVTASVKGSLTENNLFHWGGQKRGGLRSQAPEILFTYKQIAISTPTFASESWSFGQWCTVWYFVANFLLWCQRSIRSVRAASKYYQLLCESVWLIDS